jgi:hypothetical protein
MGHKYILLLTGLMSGTALFQLGKTLYFRKEYGWEYDWVYVGTVSFLQGLFIFGLWVFGVKL